MDARGFLIGSAVAYALNKPLVLFRKQGKLPADVLPRATRPNTARPSSKYMPTASAKATAY